MSESLTFEEAVVKTLESIWLECPDCGAIYYEGKEVHCVLPFESLKAYYLRGRLTDEMFRRWVLYNVSLSK